MSRLLSMAKYSSSPFFTVSFFSATLTLLVLTAVFCTFTVTVFVRPLASVISSFALPFFLPVRVQVPSALPFTVNTFVLVDFHAATESPFASPVTFSPFVDDAGERPLQPATEYS